ncbi:MAG: hypothetical protein ABL986_22035, partial [Vicinamibacterales bacterium]
MFPRFSEVLLAIEDLQQRGLLVSYAVFGAIAQMFWDEAIPTFDLDVLVVLGGQTGTLVDLGPLYQWSREKGYSAGREHIVIGEIPVQFVPAPDELHEEAIRTAAVLDFDGLPVNVVRPEYLIATWLAVNATHVVHSGVSGNNGGYHTNPLLLEGLPN